MKRLSGPSGVVAQAERNSSDLETEVIRSAILVHAGPDGDVMQFQSADGPIEFSPERIGRIVQNQNSKIQLLAAEYGGLETMPVGAWTPILDQHEDDSNDRIRGRLASLLRLETRDVPGVGKNVACAVADIRFLGAETVERVKDGRIYHLSIGIDEETDTLGEISTVIEPAAPGAMILKKIPLKGKHTMSTKTELVAAKEARLTKLKALNELLSGTKTKLVETKDRLEMSAKTAKLKSGFSKLMSAGKLSPAEFKKVELTKLAKLDQESIDSIMSVFEMREPIVKIGQRGTTAAVDFSKLAKGLENRQRARLKSEIAGDFKRLTGKPLAGAEEEEKKEMAEMPEAKEAEAHLEVAEEPKHQESMAKMAAHLARMGKHLEEGDTEKAKEVHAMLTKMAESAKGTDAHLEEGEEMEAGEGEEGKKTNLQSQVDELQAQMSRMAGMVEEMMGEEKAEGHELSAGDKEEEQEEPKGK
jgi:hypothetical protein